MGREPLVSLTVFPLLASSHTRLTSGSLGSPLFRGLFVGLTLSLPHTRHSIPSVRTSLSSVTRFVLCPPLVSFVHSARTDEGSE